MGGGILFSCSLSKEREEVVTIFPSSCPTWPGLTLRCMRTRTIWKRLPLLLEISRFLTFPFSKPFFSFHIENILRQFLFLQGKKSVSVDDLNDALMEETTDESEAEGQLYLMMRLLLTLLSMLMLMLILLMLMLLLLMLMFTLLLILILKLVLLILKFILGGGG